MGRRKGLSAAVAALGLALILSGAGCARKTSNEVERIQGAGILKVALVDTGSRYMDMAGEEPVGIEPELAKFIASALGVEVRYQVCEKTEALEAVAAGEADIALGCINNSAGLAGEYLTSTSYGKGYFYAVTRTGDYALTVGSFKDSDLGADGNLDEATRTALYQAEGVQVKDYDSWQAAGEDVKEGLIRAYICYEDQAGALLEDEELQVQNVANLKPEEFVVVAAKSDTVLINGINTLIRQFLEEE